MHFTNGSMGNCVILKEDGVLYSLVYAYDHVEFIIASGLNKETGNWDRGNYFNGNLDEALEYFNKRVQERIQEEQ